jgi:hypothetical protein
VDIDQSEGRDCKYLYGRGYRDKPRLTTE